MYEKLTLPRFKTLMHGGKYKSLTAARRAIGKASWSPDERMDARQSAHAYFQVAWRKPAPKTAPAGAPLVTSLADLSEVLGTLYVCLNALQPLSETDKGLRVEYEKWRERYPATMTPGGFSAGSTAPRGDPA